jgi:glycosyltransferase involved in cell wall biosynthesis
VVHTRSTLPRPGGRLPLGVDPHVLVLTNIIAPYLIPTFSELSKIADLCVLFCARTGIGGCDWAHPDEFPFRHRVMGNKPTLRRGWNEYYLNPRILRELARERPDVIITGGYSFPSAYAMVYCAATGCRLGVFSEGWSHSERDIRGHQRHARRLLLRAADVCIAPSTLAARRFVECGVDDSRVFHAPYLTPAFQHVDQPPRRSDTGQIRVLCVSRLIERKGIHHLLDAFRQACVLVPNLRLQIVGSGPEEERLRHLARDLRNIEFLGFVDQPDLLTLYADADIFAFPTLDDPFGMVLAEAAAAGLPAVASPFAAATADLIRHGETGFSVDPRDPSELADALVTLAQDPERRHVMGAAAQAAAAQRTPVAAAETILTAARVALAD